MQIKFIILYPFSLLYGGIMLCRNWLYNKGLLQSYRPPIPTLIVGNLSMGGTGKSPHVEFFIRNLQNNFQLAILSRGYGRKTRGYLKVQTNSTPQEVGDEPLQIKSKFPQIPFAVCEKRAFGLQQLLTEFPETNLIILDDAMQHRSVNGSFLVMLSMFDKPFFKDRVVPAGTLREFPTYGKKRAHVCIFTKCPEQISKTTQQTFQDQFSSSKPSYFSRFDYGKWELISGRQVDYDILNVLLITGIAHPEPLVKYLESQFRVEHFSFGDHHDYTDEDIVRIHRKFTNFDGRNSAIVCTEKDAVKLRNIELLRKNTEFPWYSIPIQVTLENEQELINQIHLYATTYS